MTNYRKKMLFKRHFAFTFTSSFAATLLFLSTTDAGRCCRNKQHRCEQNESETNPSNALTTSGSGVCYPPTCEAKSFKNCFCGGPISYPGKGCAEVDTPKGLHCWEEQNNCKCGPNNNCACVFNSTFDNENEHTRLE